VLFGDLIEQVPVSIVEFVNLKAAHDYAHVVLCCLDLHTTILD
jgi:hypothetical protein